MSVPAAAPVLLVLGMHRSGTSALARSARVLGADLGDKLIGSREDNPKGFWEDSDLDRLHLEMLAALGVAWTRLTPLSIADIENLENLGFGAKADDLLRAKTRGGALRAFKYPPMAKFFPFWARALSRGGYDVRYLLAIRHPLSVAQSLAKRDRLGREYSCLMLLGHVLPALPHLRAGSSVVTDYDRLMENPRREISRMAGHLGLPVDEREMDDYRQNFLTPQLRHASFLPEDLAADRGIDPLVDEVYRGLLDIASDRRSLHDPEVAGMFARWNSDFAARIPLLGLIERTTAERDRLAILLDNAEKDLAWRDASLSWRLTRPLRSACTLASRLRHGGPGKLRREPTA
jgi:hypothetical protein